MLTEKQMILADGPTFMVSDRTVTLSTNASRVRKLKAAVNSRE